MSLLEQLNKDFSQALREKDQTVIQTLRLLRSELTKKEKEGGEINDKQILQTLKSEIKKRKDSIEEYNKAGREDLSAQEEKEVKVLKKYLPEQMSVEEISRVIDQVLENFSQEEKNNFGKVMGAVMKEVDDNADGAKVNQMVKEKLGK